MRRSWLLAAILLLFLVAGIADASTLVQQGTVRNLRFFMVDSADHVTGKINLAPAVTIAKDGAGFGAPAGVITEVGGAGNGNGWYQLAATAIDTDTLGELLIHATAVGADPADVMVEVVKFNPQAVAVGAAVVGSAMTLAANAVDANALAADAITEILDGDSLAHGTAASGGAFWIYLAAATSEADDFFNGSLITIMSGPGAGQSRLIIDYIGGTDLAVVDEPWVTLPTNASVYRIRAFKGILLADTGVAVAHGANTITLSASASGIADTYIGHTIFISSGAGAGQARLIIAYNGARVATVSPAWTTTLADYPAVDTSVYKILPVGRVYVNQIAAGIISNVQAPILGRILSLVTSR